MGRAREANGIREADVAVTGNRDGVSPRCHDGSRERANLSGHISRHAGTVDVETCDTLSDVRTEGYHAGKSGHR